MAKEIDPNESIEQMKERVNKELKKHIKGLFDPSKLDDFDERGLASGSPDLLTKTDAELFPDEIEEYTPEERREKIIRDNTDKK